MNKCLLILFSLCCIPLWSQQTFNVLDYGAVADTAVLSTKGIQAAIDACAAKGGGTVVIPAGNYLSGTVVLKRGRSC